MDDIDIYESDNEVNDAVHSNLLAAVTQLEGKQRVKTSVRKEPTIEVSEFHLVNSGTGKKGEVHLLELAQVLGKRSSHNDISQKLKALNRHGKKLPKPLEKTEANRIDREVRYVNVKNQLSRWDAVVHKNRISDQLTFPLNQPNIGLGISKDFLNKFKPETKLEVEMAKVLNSGKEEEKEEAVEESEFPLTLQEMIERRKELAKLRAQQNYREAKACRQNKIKSKKYHRILRKEKVKQQLKDFEALKTSDPEAALKQLEELDRTRAEERASLRHRSTGQWAKSKAIRAKYDTESRKVLAQQLSISRELTQKISKGDMSDEDDNDNDEAVATSSNPSNNPWVGPVKTSAEIDEFLFGYRKYYEEEAKKALERSKEGEKEEESEGEINGNGDIEEPLSEAHESPLENTVKLKEAPTTPNHSVLSTERIISGQSCDVSEKLAKKKKKKILQLTPSSGADNMSNGKHLGLKKKGDSKKNINTQIVTTAAGEWIVTPSITPVIQSISKKQKRKLANRISEDIDGFFEDINDRFKENVERKIKQMKSLMSDEDRNCLKKTRKKDLPGDYLAFKKTVRRPDVDEQLNERPDNRPAENINSQVVLLAPPNLSLVGVRDDQSSGKDIDPNKFMMIKPKHLKTQLPDVITAGDEAIDDEAEKQLTIMEAFADDDVVAEFRKEKDEAAKSDQPEDISLAMPGWGSWGGKDIPVSKRKKRRFMVKKPKGPPRKDSAFGDVIISEQKDKKMREHLVNALPFPFTSVKSYEASIRAPIGNTWVPETSFRKLIAPKVQTKLGTIIEPMDEDSLVNKKSKFVNGFK